MSREKTCQKNTSPLFKTSEPDYRYNILIDKCLHDYSFDSENLFVNKMLFVLIFLMVK